MTEDSATKLVCRFGVAGGVGVWICLLHSAGDHAPFGGDAGGAARSQAHFLLHASGGAR